MLADNNNNGNGGTSNNNSKAPYFPQQTKYLSAAYTVLESQCMLSGCIALSGCLTRLMGQLIASKKIASPIKSLCWPLIDPPSCCVHRSTLECLAALVTLMRDVLTADNNNNNSGSGTSNNNSAFLLSISVSPMHWV